MSKSFSELPSFQFTEEDVVMGRVPAMQVRMTLQHGPIFRRTYPLGDHMGSVVFMIGPDANKFVLHTGREHFSNDQGWTPILGHALGKGLLNMDDPDHKVHRTMWNPGFTSAYIETYLPVIQRIIAERTSHWLQQKDMDICQQAREIAYDAAAATLAGSQHRNWVEHSRKLFFALVQPFNVKAETPKTYVQRVRRVNLQLDEMLLKLIASRRSESVQKPASDLIGLIIRARDDHGVALTDRQLLGHLKIMLVAGHETTTALGSWVLYFLATQPQHRQRVRDELDTLIRDAGGIITVDVLRAAKHLDNFIKETGRLYPPALNLPRGTIKEFEYGGYRIPVGTPVRIGIAACHRLPHIFAEPDQFDPDRFAPPREEEKRTPYGFLLFSAGERTCIGSNFAQIEAKAIAAHVLQHFDLEATASPPPHGGMWTAMVFGIRLRFRPRH